MSDEHEHGHRGEQPETPGEGLPEGYELDAEGHDLDEDTNPREAIDAARAAAATGASDGVASDGVPAERGAAADSAGATSAVGRVPAQAGGSRTARSVERVEDESVVEPADPARRRLGVWIAVGALVLLLGGIATTIAVLANAEPVALPTSTASTAATTSSSPTAPATTAAPGSATPVATPTSSPTQPAPTETSVIAPELAPVKPDQPAKGDDGVVVELSKIESVDGEGNLPGEISGPAIRLTVQLENKSDVAIDLDTVVVNAYVGADDTPANAILEPGGAPFTGSLAVGKQATGVYLFTVPVADRSDVLVGVDYRVGTSTVTFRGEIG